MKYSIISLYLLLIPICCIAQNGRLTGKVTDSVSHTPVDYATISIFKAGETTPFNGTSTDPSGAFTINNLSLGNYQLVIDFVGYHRKVIDNIIITEKKPNLSLPNISLAPTAQQLQGITVSGQKATIENRIDKIVYNTANDITSQGGMALDVLKKVPQVSVDVDGNVEVQGNSNIRFLINGKPSSIFGASLADALQSIPASQIKSIELITSPGAKYDAEGTGGIINIILKDNQAQGINGSLNLSAGSRLNNGSFNINARKGNFGISAFLNGNDQINSTTLVTTDRNSANTTADTFTHLLQNGDNKFRRQSYQTGISANWAISPHDEVTASFTYNNFSYRSIGNTSQLETGMDIDNNTFSNILSTRPVTNRFYTRSSDISFNYKKTFNKKDQELDFLYVSTYGNNASYYSQQQVYIGNIYPPSGTIGNNPGKDNETDISVDYTQPVTGQLTIEAGAKFITEQISNTALTDTMLSDGSYITNANQSYSFNYKRNIYAAYASASFSLFNKFVEGKAGLRYERTEATASFQSTNLPAYNIWSPSVVLSHQLNETQSLKVSYGYRVERPDYGDLNPFYNVSDPHNITTGNPDLKPEIGHNFELGYNKTFKKGGSIYVSGVYRYNTNDLQSYTTFYPTLVIDGTTYTDVSLAQRYNIGSEVSAGGNIYITIPIDKLNLRSNMFFADRITNNPGSPQTQGFMSRINLNASYEFAHDLVVEVYGNYRSPMRTIQGHTPAFSSYTFAARKLFWNKKASIGITMTDPFNEYINQSTVTNGQGFNQVYTRQVPYRSFGISASYKFGKLAFKEKEKENSNPQVIEN